MAMYKNKKLEMPKPKDQSAEELDLMSEEMPNEEDLMAEDYSNNEKVMDENSPLADISDEDLIAEIKSRGLEEAISSNMPEKNPEDNQNAEEL